MLPKWYSENIFGLIGVHGGAFANMHALKPGAPVIEIVNRKGPRCYAALANGMRHRYFAYFPTRMPLPWPSREHFATGEAGQVIVNRSHFLSFVTDVMKSVDAT
eukprot:4471637-Prymnesium_polylepis.1